MQRLERRHSSIVFVPDKQTRDPPLAPCGLFSSPGLVDHLNSSDETARSYGNSVRLLIKHVQTTGYKW